MTGLSPRPSDHRIDTPFQRIRVVVQNDHREKLVGILHETCSKDLVVICHGFQSNKDRVPMLSLAAAFESEGTSAFRFDFAGNGESEGSFQYGNYRREVDDLYAVVRHFRRKGRLVTAVVGHSKGGNVVLLYTAKCNDMPAVVNISGRFHLDRGMEGRLGKDFWRIIKETGYIDVKNRKGLFQYRVTEDNLMDRVTTDTRSTCTAIHEECRVLTVHGSLDKVVPVEEAFEFSKLIRNHKLHIVEGADHDYTRHQRELATAVINFVKEDKNSEDECPVKSGARTASQINSRI